MLHINDLTYRIGDRLLIDHATVALPDGAKVGLVGRNGAGKTTLFRLIAGEVAPGDRRDRPAASNARIGEVAQEAPAGPETLIDIVLAADSERAALLAEAETATDPHRIAEIHTRLADIDAHSAEARAAAHPRRPRLRRRRPSSGPCSAFSGGWRMRVALAALLFAEPDLLLLDEPTNYLDLEGALWLESYLAQLSRTPSSSSATTATCSTAPSTRILHLEHGKLTLYRGGYDAFDRAAPRARRPCSSRLKTQAGRRSASTCRPSSTASAPRPRRRARRSRG